VHRAKKIFGLMVELIEIGADRQTAAGHDEPPSLRPWSARAGQRRFGDHSERLKTAQVDSVLSADGRRPARLARKIAPGRGEDKSAALPGSDSSGACRRLGDACV
jgi:hypothetical protein